MLAIVRHTESMKSILTPQEMKARLQLAGVSVEELAKRAGIHRATLYRWLQGRNSTLANYQKVVDALEKLPTDAQANP